tara:strand:+ start:23283 stop:23921 length:639 start_codon:yes stop_codon:yes gene_type:complete
MIFKALEFEISFLSWIVISIKMGLLDRVPWWAIAVHLGIYATMGAMLVVGPLNIKQTHFQRYHFELDTTNAFCLDMSSERRLAGHVYSRNEGPDFYVFYNPGSDYKAIVADFNGNGIIGDSRGEYLEEVVLDHDNARRTHSIYLDGALIILYNGDVEGLYTGDFVREMIVERSSLVEPDIEEVRKAIKFQIENQGLLMASASSVDGVVSSSF